MRLRIALALLFFASTAANAAQLVSEGVTYSSVTGLYTYNYAVDNRTGTEAVVEIEVLIIPGVSLFQLPPLLHTSPPGWEFHTSFGGDTANAPGGTFQQWYNSIGVAPGQYLSGFSFSTPYGPVSSPTPNYELFKVPSSTFDKGIVAAPQLPIDIPLFGTEILLMLAAGVALAGALAIRA